MERFTASDLAFVGWLHRAMSINLRIVLNVGSYILAFSLGAGPVPALLLPEIFASRIRAKAVSLSMGVHWVSISLSLWSS